MIADLVEAVRRDLGSAPAADRVIPGRIVRFATNGKRGDMAGWLMLFEDQRAATYGDWRTGASHTWCAGEKRGRKADRALAAAAQVARAVEATQRHSEAAARAALIWTRANVCDGHPYLTRKRVHPEGLRVQFGHAEEFRGQFYAPGDDGNVEPLRGLLLLVPMRDLDRRLWSLQAIDADGRKSFLRGGRMKGMFHILGRDRLRGADDDWTGTIAIAEGVATAATVVEKQRWPTAVAFNAGNLVPVALAIRKRLMAAQIVITGDVDPVGRQRAAEAAGAAKGMVAFPPLTEEQIAAGQSDWNDYFATRSTQPKRETA